MYHNIFYDSKYDVLNLQNIYLPKENFISPNSKAINKIKNNSYVLDIGCNDGSIANTLIKKKNCKVVGIDQYKKNLNYEISEFYETDLDKDLPDLDYNSFDFILLLDVIEHVKDPEAFMKKLYNLNLLYLKRYFPLLLRFP